MTREIKFRAWDGKNMHWLDYSWNDHWYNSEKGGKASMDNTNIGAGRLFNSGNLMLMQYTGFKDSKGIECYEGDIKREEIEEDDGDRTFYYVCVWVKEWAMFAWICITDGEYQKYLDEGADSLDEVMFWTYSFDAEDIANAKICGNIYQNPELLNP